MLIIGGVAVPLAALPDWAQHVSAFFPGRYAVEAFQACVTGDGLAGARFDLLALTLIGGAGCLAGARLFRWDAREHFAARRDKGWVGVALVGWLAVGLLAEWGGQITILATSTGSQVAEAMPARPAPAPAPAPASPPPGNESSTAPARAELPTAVPRSIAPAPPGRLRWPNLQRPGRPDRRRGVASRPGPRGHHRPLQRRAQGRPRPPPGPRPLQRRTRVAARPHPSRKPRPPRRARHRPGPPPRRRRPLHQRPPPPRRGRPPRCPRAQPGTQAPRRRRRSRRHRPARRRRPRGRP